MLTFDTVIISSILVLLDEVIISIQPRNIQVYVQTMPEWKDFSNYLRGATATTQESGGLGCSSSSVISKLSEVHHSTKRRIIQNIIPEVEMPPSPSQCRTMQCSEK
ncbi:hypothetical protein CHARACLAT_011484 [Characodon lateralis]|uniref:Uncharacterized protein n=1 Tax=Characodon lateralis TaxID=208331 RepID=A0ABU7ETB4_9TELE|nr:hypothetical protein [Characodon lateralis]